MATQLSALMREVLASPLGDVIAAVGEGVADAQEALDAASVAKSLELYREGGDEMVSLLRDIGYQPTFYTLPETVGEVSVALSLGERATASKARTPISTAPTTGNIARIAPAQISKALADRRTVPVRSYATPVDASYANRYNYAASASTKLTFKIVPVPPPEAMESVRQMPNLIGQSVEASALVMDILGLPVEFEDGDGNAVAEPDPKSKVTASRPEPGEIATTDAGVVLVIES